MSWSQDVRYAARSLRKSPGFTLVAAITLALGVGANTAIFSVVNAVMLRPLPFSNPAQLVRIWESNIERNRPTFAVSHPNFLDWRAQAKSFQAMAALDNIGLTRAALTVAEVALSVALLIGAGLLIRSFARLQQVTPGFNTSGLMTARVGLPNTSYPGGPPKRAFFELLLNDLRGRPGIEAAAIVSGPPLAGDFTGGDVKLPTQSNEEAGSAAWRLAGPGYFAAMGIPLRGREFTSQDVTDAPPVAIISATLAERYFPNQDPIGRALVMRSFTETPHTVVGVAGDVKTFGLEAEAGFVFYGAATQYPTWNPMMLVWRSRAPSIDTVRASLRSIDANVPLSAVESMDRLFEQSMGPRRFNLYLLTAFAGGGRWRSRPSAFLA